MIFLILIKVIAKNACRYIYELDSKCHMLSAKFNTRDDAVRTADASLPGRACSSFYATLFLSTFKCAFFFLLQMSEIVSVCAVSIQLTLSEKRPMQ